MLLTVRLPLTLALLSSLFLLSGCGEQTVVASSSSKVELSHACIDCHGNERWVSPGTGNLIVEEWKLSNHNKSNAAGCADCHEPEPGHTGCNLCHGGTPAGSSNNVSKNPDEDNKCAKCHGSTNGWFPRGAKRAHFVETNASLSFGSYTASYVSANYLGKCRKCHNPHNPTSDIEYNRQWVKSGHGAVTAGHFTRYDFKLYGTSQPANLAYTHSTPAQTTDPTIIARATPVCVRCHTTTGYVNFVSSNFLDVRPFGSSADKTKEVTGCDACHTGYGFKLRKVPKVSLYYNFSGSTQASISNPVDRVKIQNNKIDFPDLGSSNMCVPCHAGRGVGSLIKALDSLGVNFAKIDSPGAHNIFTGAALLTAKSGYEFVGKEYGTGVGSATGHDTAGLSSGKGPCVTCHMNKAVKQDSHSFKPVIHSAAQFDLYTSNRSWTQVYNVGSASLASKKISSLTSLSCNTAACHAGITVDQLNNDKEGFISALAVLNQWVRLIRNVPVSAPLSPVCVDNTNPPRLLTKWNYYGTGPDLMGAAYNLSTLSNEPGAYVHNPLYAKRLIYDSISYLMLAESQSNVADAIRSLVGNTRRYYTIKPVTPAKTAGVALLCSDYTSDTVAITPQQAAAAINWLYGTPTPADKFKRPGDN